jgi:hypothetical protein
LLVSLVPLQAMASCLTPLKSRAVPQRWAPMDCLLQGRLGLLKAALASP